MSSSHNSPNIGIFGAGFSGLCAAIQLRKQLNINSFTLFDEHDEVGGAWLQNIYPGCECDIPSHTYSYSFEPNPAWTKMYAGQAEILEYLKSVAGKYQLYEKINFHHRVISAEWDEGNAQWVVKVLNLKSKQEKLYMFDFIVLGTGALRVPNIPDQFQFFENPKMHSSQWNPSIDLHDKVVAIIGSGASAVQIIPAIVNKVKRLIVYQRNPPWVVPKMQVGFPIFIQRLLGIVPGAQKAVRSILYWTHELFHPAFKAKTLMNKLLAKVGKLHLQCKVSDFEKRQCLVPNYDFGCKRLIISNVYYPALDKEHVRIVTSKIVNVTEDAIFAADGSCEKPDVLITATGFKTQDFFAPLVIKGKGGEDLQQKWQEFGPCAYLGVSCRYAPNAFFILGPNSGLAQNSKIITVECQVNWMVQVIQEMINRNVRTSTVKKSAEMEYMDSMLTSMKSTVWGAGSCSSWYANDKGEVTALWPERVTSFYNRSKHLVVSDIDFD